MRNLRGKVILVRCDFSVPIIGKKVIDDFKIVKSLPTIRLLTSQGAKVVLITHLGRPNGKKSKKFILNPICAKLSVLLGKKVRYIDDVIGLRAKNAVKALKDGQIILLDNLRFYKGEEKNDENFAKKLANLADIYVNNAIAVSHRRHASVAAIKKFLPSYAGLLLEEEIISLQKALRPKKPLVLVIGGSKIETKVPVVKSLKKKASFILVGGMISHDFLAAKKFSTGKYKVSQEAKKMAKSILSRKIILPVDFVTATGKKGDGDIKVYSAKDLKQSVWQFDIGPETIRLYSRYLKKAKTIIWNGPMGMFENDHFKHGTLAIARVVASVSSGKAFGVVGGGETVSALKQTKMLDYVDWISTGGGAMLAYLAGDKMPGLEGLVN
ncbi:MAG: phosphoglycerate kinase [bacterium]|nr:phosphoglycerate kinase [bacterium]